jgi:aminoglycoside phosphotransferase (APT) family kinase protein
MKWSDQATELGSGETSTRASRHRCFSRAHVGREPISRVGVSAYQTGCIRRMGHRTFHLGAGMTVRLPSAARYSAQVEKEQRWLPRLAPLLPLPIPVPLAMGVPAQGYPWHWSVYRWLEGQDATIEHIADLRQFALTLAEFLLALQRIDPAGGAAPGPHNFYRGGSLQIYDAQTRQAIRDLAGTIDRDAVTSVWDDALKASWRGRPVWLHGDVSAGNLLVTRGRLSAVVDVGDPAGDVVIAWTLFARESREAFRAALPLETGTWVRGRGWALWKALITLAEDRSSCTLEAAKARQVVSEVVAEHQHA